MRLVRVLCEGWSSSKLLITLNRKKNGEYAKLDINIRFNQISPSRPLDFCPKCLVRVLEGSLKALKAEKGIKMNPQLNK